MMAIRKAKEADSNIYFDVEKKIGVLLQPRLNQAIFFVNGEQKDRLDGLRHMKASEVDAWIKSKRNLYIKEMQRVD
jgi:hypothetical protein